MLLQSHLEQSQAKIKELEAKNWQLTLQMCKLTSVLELKKNIPAESTVLKEKRLEKEVEAPAKKWSESQERHKLQFDHILGLNARDMVKSISAKIRKGPIPRKSDNIPICPIHQVPTHSTIGKAIEDLGNLLHKAKVLGDLNDPDGDSSSSTSDSDSSSSTGNNTGSNKHKTQKSKSKK